LKLQKIIAREWLNLLVFIMGALSLYGSFIFGEVYIVRRHLYFVRTFKEYFSWFYIIVPYAFFLFVRSIIWSINQLKNR